MAINTVPSGAQPRVVATVFRSLGRIGAGHSGGTKITAEHQTVVLTAVHKLGQLAQLGPNWDSYGAEPISPAAIARALELLNQVDSWFGFVPPSAAARSLSVAPIADGGVAIEWQGPRRALEIEVSPTAELAYLLIERSEDGPQYTEVGGASLRDVLKRVAQVLSTPAS